MYHFLQMGSRHALVALVLAGCGRFGFDPFGEDAAVAPVAMSLELPGGGTIRSLTSGADGTWYAVSERGQGYRSTDGQTWTPCGERRLTAMAVASDGRVYGSGTDVGISSDQCATWVPSVIDRFTDHVVAPGTDVFALADIGLRKRIGSTWTPVSTPLDGSRFVAYSGRPGTSRVAAVYTAGVVVSPDGLTWTAETAGLPTLNVFDVAASPTRMYAITGPSAVPGGIACADGTGLTWTTCYPLGGIAIAVDPTNDDHVVAGIYDNLGETTNAFASTRVELRETVGLDAANIYDLHYLPSGDLLSASARGVFFSPAGPLAFQPRNTGLAAWNVYGMLRDGNDVFLGTEGGVLHSAGGAPFTGSTSGMRFSTRTRDLVRASDGSLIAAGRSLWRSVDDGQTWEILNTLRSEDGFNSHAVAVAGTRIFAGSATRLLYADPPWTTWTARLVGAAQRRVHAIVLSGAEIWLATEDGLFVSTNEAASFTPIAAVAATCRTLLALADGSLAAGCENGVWISDVGRTSWQRRGLATFDTRDLLETGTTLVAATSSGLLATTDRGATWTEVGGSGLDLHSVIVDPADGSLVYGGVGVNLRRATLP